MYLGLPIYVIALHNSLISASKLSWLHAKSNANWHLGIFVIANFWRCFWQEKNNELLEKKSSNKG